MPVLNTNPIDAVKLGSTNIDAIYKAGAKIWPVQTPLAGLLAEYRFADGNTLGDTSGNGRTALATAATSSPTIELSNARPSVAGSSVFYRFPSAFLLNEFTIEGWVSAQIAGDQFAAGKFLHVADTTESAGVSYSGNQVWCRSIDKDGSTKDGGNQSLSLSASETSGVAGDSESWVHVAVTMKGATLRLWVAGQSQSIVTRKVATPINAKTIIVCESTAKPGGYRVAGLRLWDHERYTANFTPDAGLLNP